MLAEHYAEPHRAYHNLSHVAALLMLADDVRAHIRHPEVVDLAIWFHDVIYDTRSADNEERSADFAHDAMRTMQIHGELIAAVRQCVLAMQRHEVLLQSHPDVPLFLDLDLSILGATEDIYRHYRDAIRTEYGWVADQEYCAGRASVLKKFQARPQLYFTRLMADRYEERARHNIALEVRDLMQESGHER
ncbi:hypothetical protein GCM10027343_30320 [Noviherbaspirillum agri]